MMLSEGKGGMSDFGKYRELLTDIFWHGKMPEKSPEDAVESARAAIGTPTPAEALAEARAMYERAKAAKPPEGGAVN